MGIWVRVCCDRCGYLLPGFKNRQILPLADIEKLAENKGWLIRNHSIYCPLCRAKYEDTDDLCTAAQALKESEAK